MAKQTFTTGQVLTAAQMTSLQQTAMGGGSTTAKTVSYTLVAADAGTVVQMNSASATTITVNTALFAAGDSVQIQNIGAGVCTVTAGTATVNTAGSLALSQYENGTLYFTATGASLFFDTIQSGAAQKVIQVVQGTTTTAVGNSTNTYADTTLTATITPTLATSKVLVLVSQNGLNKSNANAANRMSMRLLRDATQIVYVSDGTGNTGTTMQLQSATNSVNYLDTPATTSATTYKTQFLNPGNAASVAVQVNGTEMSTIILMEIGV